MGRQSMNNMLQDFRHLELRKDCDNIEPVEKAGQIENKLGALRLLRNRDTYYLRGVDHSTSSTLSFAIQQ